MDVEMREKMIMAFDQAINEFGAPNFEEGMRRAKRLSGIVNGLVGFANSFIQPIQTIANLRKALDSQMSLSERDQALLLIALESLPQLLRLEITTFSEKAAATLPPLPAGRRRTFTAKKAQEVLDYVSQLNRKGAPMPAAKDRAAKKYRCSRRTIDRLWKDRESAPLEDPPTLQDIISIFLKEAEADGWQVPVDWETGQKLPFK